jgi:transposase
MIAAPANARIWIAAGVTDLRRGFSGLSALVQTALEQDPYAGHVFVFRGRRGDLIKLLWWDGDGLCLFAKAFGAWPLHLAASGQRHRVIDTSATVDAVGRHRLAATVANMEARDDGLAKKQ